MNKFGKETLDIKGLELEDLSESYGIKELGVKEVANGAGISGVGVAAVEGEGKNQVREIILCAVIGGVIVAAVILAYVILGLYLCKQEKKQEELDISSQGLADVKGKNDKPLKFVNEGNNKKNPSTPAAPGPVPFSPPPLGVGGGELSTTFNGGNGLGGSN